MIANLMMALLAAGAAGFQPGAPQRDAAVAQLLAMHEEVMAAHRSGDASAVLDRAAAEYVQVGRGEVSFPTREEQDGRFRAYLRTTRFSKYEDLIEPVVQVSPDGRLGWVIAQVAARGVQERGDGTGERVEFVCAWIELYEKRDGRWYRVGDLSTFRPQDAAP